MAQSTAPMASYDPLAPVQVLTDPSAVEFVAAQLNDKTQNQNRAQGALSCRDLTDCIVDIVIDTVAQGASTIEVHIHDPFWVLMMRPAHGAPAFFDVDDAGLLIPVDVNFPRQTDRWWRLAQANPTVDPTTPNIFVFEDRIVADLRDIGGAKHAGNNQTRAQFIYSCVRQVPGIRFVCPALNAPAGSVGGDVTQGQINTTGILAGSNNAVAQSALNPNAPSARRNPAKRPGIARGPRGAHWTKNGWRYTKPIDGLSPTELSILNPPTNQPDGDLVARVGAGVAGAGSGIGGL
jgi:hypothetical protein